MKWYFTDQVITCVPEGGLQRREGKETDLLKTVSFFVLLCSIYNN